MKKFILTIVVAALGFVSTAFALDSEISKSGNERTVCLTTMAPSARWSATRTTELIDDNSANGFTKVISTNAFRSDLGEDWIGFCVTSAKR